MRICADETCAAKICFFLISGNNICAATLAPDIEQLLINFGDQTCAATHAEDDGAAEKNYCGLSPSLSVAGNSGAKVGAPKNWGKMNNPNALLVKEAKKGVRKSRNEPNQKVIRRGLPKTFLIRGGCPG